MRSDIKELSEPWSIDMMVQDLYDFTNGPNTGLTEADPVAQQNKIHKIQSDLTKNTIDRSQKLKDLTTAQQLLAKSKSPSPPKKNITITKP